MNLLIVMNTVFRLFINFKYLNKQLPTTLRLRFHHGACPALRIIHTTQGGWPRRREELGKPRPPENTLFLTMGRSSELYPDIPTVPAGGQQGKCSSDVAWGIVRFGVFVVCCFVFLLLLFSF